MDSIIESFLNLLWHVGLCVMQKPYKMYADYVMFCNRGSFTCMTGSVLTFKRKDGAIWTALLKNTEEVNINNFRHWVHILYVNVLE